MANKDALSLIEKAQKKFELDPRMKLLIVLVFTTFLLTASNVFVLAWMYFLIVLLFLINRSYKRALKCALLFIICLGMEGVLFLLPKNKVMAVIGMIFYLFERLFAAYGICFWMADHLRINDFVTALQNMHMPKGGTIAFAVIFRYIPTVQNEFRSIKNTMKLRGIGFSAKNIFCHPLKSTEYAMIPLILRSMTIADELAASAMTRGLDLNTKRSSYREVKLTFKDYIYTLLIIFAVSIGHIINHIVQIGMVN